MASRIPSTDGRRRARIARGFTLAEGLIAATVLAASVMGIFAPLSVTHRQTSLVQENGSAVLLAEQLMEEITAKPYADPTDGTVVLGPGADEPSRAAFDNVSDYHGYIDTTAALQTAGGEPVAWSAGDTYRRSVTVEFRDTPAGPAVASGDLAVVTVTVTGPSGQQVTLWRLVARYPVQ